MTIAERLILANQHRILALLDSEQSEHHKRLATIFARGYQREYPLQEGEYVDEFHPGIAGEVYDILDMYRALHFGYAALENKNGIDPADLRFRGFDLNHEGEHWEYARFLIDEVGYWEESKGAADKLNSHSPTLDRYRRMVRRWKESADCQSLTTDEILHIVAH